jgi:uncharacterized protein
MSHEWIIVITGTVIGFFSGLFGIGGSSVATPVLRVLDVPRLIALASPLPATLPIGLAGGLAYWRRGLVHWRIVGWTVLGGVPAVAAGAWLTEIVPGRVLMALAGLFVFAVGLRVLLARPRTASARSALDCAPALLLAIGVGSGFLSGLLANGGGFLLVPAYLILCRLTPAQAAANALIAAAILTVPDALVHWHLGHIDPRLVLLLSAGVLPAAYLGARVGMALRPAHARLLFGCFMILFGAFFLARTIHRAEVYGWLSQLVAHAPRAHA